MSYNEKKWWYETNKYWCSKQMEEVQCQIYDYIFYFNIYLT